METHADAGRPCRQTLAEACADAGPTDSIYPACCTDGPGCLGRLPQTLDPFCAHRLQADGGVYEWAGCYGLTIVDAPGGLDTSRLYFYDAQGLLVAVGGWSNASEVCAAGPADFAYPMKGQRNATNCPSISTPQCCPSLPPVATYGCPIDAGATDGSRD